jgi:hypothetical protein
MAMFTRNNSTAHQRQFLQGTPGPILTNEIPVTHLGQIARPLARPARNLGFRQVCAICYVRLRTAVACSLAAVFRDTVRQIARAILLPPIADGSIGFA